MISSLGVVSFRGMVWFLTCGMVWFLSVVLCVSFPPWLNISLTNFISFVNSVSLLTHVPCPWVTVLSHHMYQVFGLDEGIVSKCFIISFFFLFRRTLSKRGCRSGEEGNRKEKKLNIFHGKNFPSCVHIISDSVSLEIIPFCTEFVTFIY